MRKATSILLEDDSEAFIDKQIAEGHFSNPSEVIEAGLRLLKDHDDEIEAIRAALIEGEESGIAEDFDSEIFLKQMRENMLPGSRAWRLTRAAVADLDSIWSHSAQIWSATQARSVSQ